jgi:Sensors of blue-light using FAD.
MLLYRYVFYSENSGLPGGRAGAEQVKDILLACSRNTLASGLSGALVFNERYFVQIMEGDRALASRTILSVVSDPRHRNAVLVRAYPVGERRFLGWTVGYAGHTEAIDALYMRHGVMAGLDPTRMNAESIENLVADLVEVKSPFIVRKKGIGSEPAPPAGRPEIQGEVIRVRAAMPLKPPAGAV